MHVRKVDESPERDRAMSDPALASASSESETDGEEPEAGLRSEHSPETERQLEASDGEDRRKARLTTAFGWVAGGSAGLLVSHGLGLAFGESYPLVIGTFIGFVVGAFSGMHIADRLGARGFRPLGIAAGLLLAVALAAFAAALSAPAG